MSSYYTTKQTVSYFQALVTRIKSVDGYSDQYPVAFIGENYEDESFENDLLEYPHYTRPREFMGLNVPDVLLSGNHQKIEAWRKEQAIEITKKRRKDLYKKYCKK